GELVKKMPGETEPRLAAAVSPDAKFALVSTIPHSTKHGKIDRTTLQLWDLSKGKIALSFGGTNQFYPPHVFSPNGKLIASLGWESKNDGAQKANAQLWTVPTGKVVKVIGPLGGFVDIRFSPSGKELLLAGPELIRLETQTGKLLRKVSLP